MEIPVFHVDAFADRPLSGNPAALCLLNSWLDDETLRKVAAENNLSATAFLVREADGYRLRWFTTCCEIKLCGHATLAAGFVILNLVDAERQSVQFETQYAGKIKVRMENEFVRMDFPALPPSKSFANGELFVRALGLQRNPREVLESNQTLIAVLDSAQGIVGAVPDFRLLEELHPYAVAITAPGESEDFVTRYFAPTYGVLEDSVTGSVHCALAPYWSKRFGKNKLHARQLSERGGELWCELAAERIALSGRAILTMRGSLSI